MAAPRDRTTVRRALKAGGVVAVLVGAPLVVAAVVGAPALWLAAVFAGLTVGTLFAAAWLLLAGVLDVSAGVFPGRGRVAVTVVVTLLAMLTPFLLLAALTPR